MNEIDLNKCTFKLDTYDGIVYSVLTYPLGEQEIICSTPQLGDCTHISKKTKASLIDFLMYKYGELIKQQ